MQLRYIYIYIYMQLRTARLPATVPFPRETKSTWIPEASTNHRTSGLVHRKFVIFITHKESPI